MNNFTLIYQEKIPLYLPLKDSYLEKEIDALRGNQNERFLAADKKRLANLGPIILFSDYKLSSSSGKEIEQIDQAHIACLLYNILTSPRDYEDLSIGFTREIIIRAEERIAIKRNHGNFHV